ncbi:fructokinase-1 [Rhodobacteraceae bacterium KLH11]|nr:fructokinase-1 [Rhodobacteraceae bacterium KLH11]
MTAPSILCLGEPMVEFAQLSDGRWQQGIGGDVSNVAIAAARLGMSAGLISAVGDDAFGQELRRIWRREGVDHGGVGTIPNAPTGLYFIRQTDAGHAFEYRRSGSAASRLSPSDLPRDVIASAEVLHLSGISLAISASSRDAADAAVDLARAANRKVSFDPNLRLALWPLEKARTQCHRMMAKCDIALPGLEDARLLTGLQDPGDIVRYYLDMGPSIVALTMGEDGALLATSDRVHHVPARSVAAVDASGAGDCFDGAFLSRLLLGADPTSACRYAVAASALAVQGIGAVNALPTADRVSAFVAA